LKHHFFSFLTHASLIEQSFGETFAVAANENITTVKAAEKTHHVGESDVDLFIADTLEAFSHFHVGVVRHVLRSGLARVHKVLEGSVTSLLELHIIVEAIFEHGVHFFFKRKQIFGEQDRVLQVTLIFNDGLTSAHDVGVHATDDRQQSALVSAETLVHQF
jgi:hypothetical protein